MTKKLSKYYVHYLFRTQYYKHETNVLGNEELLIRQKRQLDDFEDDVDQYAAASNQDSAEEPGFWDRVVKVALKLFNRFIEWLNS